MLPPDCRFPELSERHDRALREAVAFILERFEPLGIIACGSIVRGNPSPMSDHDLQVLVSGTRRLRIQKSFAGVPAEIFVNPPQAIERYLERERRENRPATAHMIATGFVVLDRDPVVEELRARATRELERGPEPDPDQLTWLRYTVALRYEDGVDLVESDPDTASFLLASAVVEMLRLVFFTRHGRSIPRWKETLDLAEEIDPEVGALVRCFFRSPSLEERVRVAGELADRIADARGFFEWESPERELDDF